MNAPTNKTRAMLITTLLLGLGASALAGGITQAPAPQPAAPSITLQGQPAPPAPGQPGPRGGHGPRDARPSPAAPGQMDKGQMQKGQMQKGQIQMPKCVLSAAPVKPIAPGAATPGRAQPTPPTPGAPSAQPAAPVAPKGDRMDQGMGPKDKGGKGEVCPPAPRGMGQTAPSPATPNAAAPAARDLGRVDTLATQTSDTRIRGYLNDARAFLQSASKAQQKAGRDLLHAAESLIGGNQTPQR